MPIRFPSIPEPGNDAASQLNTLRAIKQVVDILAANATGDRNPSGPGAGAQIFALQDDVRQLMINQTATLTNTINQNQTNTQWTVDQAVSSLNQDISDARNRAIQARTDALQALDDFENSTFLQTIYRIDEELADANAAISSEAGARSTADDAQSGRITKAAAFIGLNESSWREGDLSVATRFNAMSTGYKEYIARTGDDFLSSYTTHVVTTTDFTNAVSTRLDTLETKLTVPSTPDRPPLLLSSAIIDESNATSDATKKIATAQNIQTTVASLSNVAGQNGATTDGAITAAVKVESQARTTAIDNIKSTAAYSVVVSTTGPSGPAVTGFRAVSDSSSTTPISDFQIFADKFRITNGSATKTPFSIDTINSKINMSADVAINGNLVVSGTIDSPQLRNNSVSTVSFISGVGSQSIYVTVRPSATIQVSALYNSGDSTSETVKYSNFDGNSNTNKPGRATINIMGYFDVERWIYSDPNFTVLSSYIQSRIPVLGYLYSSGVSGAGAINVGGVQVYYFDATFYYTSLAANNIFYYKNNSSSNLYLKYTASTTFAAVNGYTLLATELAR